MDYVIVVVVSNLRKEILLGNIYSLKQRTDLIFRAIIGMIACGGNYAVTDRLDSGNDMQ